jgi:putative FmdB family regulatory protein
LTSSSTAIRESKVDTALFTTHFEQAKDLNMTYEYLCTACGHAWEAEQSISAAPLTTCPTCHAEAAKRQVSGGAGFILKGGGWYADLYSSPKAGGSKEGSSKEGGSKEGGSSAATKPAESTSSSDTSSPKTDSSTSSATTSSTSTATKPAGAAAS